MAALADGASASLVLFIHLLGGDEPAMGSVGLPGDCDLRPEWGLPRTILTLVWNGLYLSVLQFVGGIGQPRVRVG